jgi:hypothetical protein
MEDAEQCRAAEAWVRYNVTRKHAHNQRDADAIREARSEAWKMMFAEAGCTIEKAIAAATPRRSKHTPYR